MSKTVDERVVEMRFDNKQFESNVSTSMSTLDKLKKSLKLDGAAKGLENIDSASKKVNMSTLGSAVESVKLKFSALDVMAVTALTNITNSAINAGKRMASALTIDPVMSGFREYETQINAVQTILANTQSKGTTIDQVNEALDELNHYADLTIYNFTEMTRNIGTFTAAGIDLETSVSAIQGIANLAAVSGSTSQQASVAMYQLSQALAAGTVKLMDWNSVVNAGMGGQVFQDALKETSELLGTGAEAAIKAKGSFRESLSTGWLTSQVLTETLKKFTTSGANEYVAKYTGLSKDAVKAALDSAEAQYGEADAIEHASQALAKKSGKNKDEIKAALQMAKNAEDAATKVKTFTQLWDVLKEAAQSGWTKTWQLIIGDFEEAKNLLTPLSDFFTGMINKMSDWRNDLLESALGRGFTYLKGAVNSLTEPAAKAAEVVTAVKDSLEDLDTMVGKVINGDFGNGKERFDKLTESGYNYYKIQNKVNETLHDGFRYTEDEINAQDKLLGSQQKTNKSTSESKTKTEELTDAQKKHIIELSKMSEEQLRAAGYTEQQIRALNRLKNTAEKLGLPLEEFINNLDEINGRWLLLNSFKNIGKALMTVFQSIGKAWQEMFKPLNSSQIFDVIAAVHKFTASLIPSKENAENLTRTFKGLFAVLDIVRTILGGGIKFAFNILSQILGAFDLNILDVTANIGDMLVSFRDWLLEGNAVSKFINSLIEKIPECVAKIREWFDAFKETPAVQKLVSAINSIRTAFHKLTSGDISIGDFAKSLGSNLAKAVKSLPEIAMQIGVDFIDGFKNGLKFSVSEVIDNIISFCTNFVNAFRDVLGVHSPSWKAYDTAVDFFQGFINGAKDALKGVIDIFKRIGEQILKAFQSLWNFITDESGNIDWGKIIAGGIIVAILLVVKQLATALNGIANALGGLDDLLAGAAGVLKSFSKVLNAKAWEIKAEAVKKMATAIAILVASVWVLTQIDDIGKLWNAVGIIAALALILIGLSFAMSKLSDASASIDKNGFKLDGLKTGLIQIGIAMVLLAAVVKIIGDMDPEKAERGFVALAEMAGGMMLFMLAMAGVNRLAGKSADFGKTVTSILGIGSAMLIMANALKIIGNMDPADIVIGLAVMEVFILFCVELGVASFIAGDNADSFGKNVLKISAAMIIMTFTLKLIAGMDPGDVLKGLIVMETFVLLVLQMAIINRIAGSAAKGFGRVILSISASMLILTGVLWLLSNMDESAVQKGIKTMQSFVLLIAEMLLISKLGGKEGAKIASSILAMSVSIAILAGVAILLSMIDEEGMKKGLTAVSILALLVSMMAYSLKGANNVMGTMIAMTVAIGLLVAAVVALTFIDADKIAVATAALSSLMLMFGVMTKLSSGAKASIGSIAIMLIVLGMLTAMLLLLSSMKIGQTIEIAASLSLLMLSLSASLAIISAVGPMAAGAIGGIIAMMLVLGGIAAVLGILASIPNVKNTLEIAESLSMLLLALSGACLIIAVGAAIMTVAGAGIAIMIGVIVAMGALMAAIAGLVVWQPDLEEFLSKSLPILKLIGQGIGEFLGGIITGIGDAVLDLLPKFGQALSSFMVGVQPFILLAQNVDSDVAVGAGYLAAAILVLSAANFIAGVTSILSLGQGSFDKLGMQLMVFGIGAKTFLAAIKDVDGNSVEAAKNLGAVVLALSESSLISGISEFLGISTDFSQFGEKLKTFGTAVIEFSDIVGDIDSTKVQAATNAGMMIIELNKALPRTGGWIQDLLGEQDLDKFSKSCAAFALCMIDINAAISSDDFKMENEKISQLVQAGERFNELNKALPKTGGIAQDLAGEQDLTKFGEACKAFARCMISINKSVSGEDFVVQSDRIAKLVEAGKHFNELNTALPKTGGIAQDLAGEQDLAKFGKACAAFVGCLIDINAAVSKEGFAVNLQAMEDLKKAGLKMNELQNALPKSGGWWQSIAGEKDIGDFGKKIDAFGDALATFSSTEVDTGKVYASLGAASRIKSFIENLTDLDTSGLAVFTGVGTGGPGADGAAYKIAKAMAAYSDKVANIDISAVSTSVTAAMKLKTLISSLTNLDTSGIENFKVGSIGSAMKGYADKVSGIDVGTVSKSVNAATRLKTLIANLANLDTSGISKFRVGSIGTSLKTYASSVSGVDFGAVSNSITAANRLKTFITSLTSFNSNGVSAFTKAVNQLGTVDVSKIVTAFSGASTKMYTAGGNMISKLVTGMQSKLPFVNTTVTSAVTMMCQTMNGKVLLFHQAGANMMMLLSSGIAGNKATVSSAVASCMASAASKAYDYYTSFYNAGSYLVSGFCNGISANSYRAAAKASAMAYAAEQAARSALKINSPSKVFKEIGSGIPEGFAMGIGMLDRDVKNSVTDMAASAITSTRSAMATVLDALNGDIDAQPTIRPVIDLTNVRDGANSIRSLLGGANTVGVRADLNAISSTMNRRIQNGTTDDVISAINKLNDGLANNRGDTYNFGDFTYDDGSNISDAVQTLVRAARMGRRV